MNQTVLVDISQALKLLRSSRLRRVTRPPSRNQSIQAMPSSPPKLFMTPPSKCTRPKAIRKGRSIKLAFPRTDLEMLAVVAHDIDVVQQITEKCSNDPYSCGISLDGCLSRQTNKAPLYDGTRPPDQPWFKVKAYDRTTRTVWLCNVKDAHRQLHISDTCWESYTDPIKTVELIYNPFTRKAYYIVSFN